MPRINNSDFAMTPSESKSLAASGPRYRVFKRGAFQWFVVDWHSTRDMAGPFSDRFGADDYCARLNNPVTA